MSVFSVAKNNQYLLFEYGTFSELKVTVAAGETKFDFDLKVEESDFKKK